MKIATLVEPIAAGGYRASLNQPFGLAAEGSTVEEAVGLLKSQVEARLASGARVVEIDVSGGEHPLAPFAGMFRDNPLFGEWQEEIVEYRRQIDEDPDVL